MSYTKERIIIIGSETEELVSKLKTTLGERYNSFEFTFADSKADAAMINLGEDDAIQIVDGLLTEPTSKPRANKLMAMLSMVAPWEMSDMDWDISVRGSSGGKIDRRVVKETLYSGSGQHTSTKINRNDPCTCGSGNKYKKCCISK